MISFLLFVEEKRNLLRFDKIKKKGIMLNDMISNEGKAESSC